MVPLDCVPGRVDVICLLINNVTGLFLGCGKSLASAGPGGAVVAYILMGTGE
jgi:amino acid permease